jgi:hypothetical protein
MPQKITAATRVFERPAARRHAAGRLAAERAFTIAEQSIPIRHTPAAAVPLC